MSACFMVRAKLANPSDREAFDRWYRDEHFPEAVKALAPRQAWRGWSDLEPLVHTALYEFDTLGQARALPGSEAMKRLVAEFDRAWGEKVVRERDRVEVVQSHGARLPRAVLDESHIHPAIRDKVATNRMDFVREVQAAIAEHAVVVVGMRQNPWPKKARRLLERAGIAHRYLEYGSYLSAWRRRNALKMWTGWPTFPMVFVKGTLVGGAQDLERLIASGELKKLLAQT
jgi:monothiol glutaredoxin